VAFLRRNEPRSLAEIHDERGCARTAGEVQRAALLAVEAGDLSWRIGDEIAPSPRPYCQPKTSCGSSHEKIDYYQSVSHGDGLI
jgi:hypothetical protein